MKGRPQRTKKSTKFGDFFYPGSGRQKKNKRRENVNERESPQNPALPNIQPRSPSPATPEVRPEVEVPIPPKTISTQTQLEKPETTLTPEAILNKIYTDPRFPSFGILFCMFQILF